MSNTTYSRMAQHSGQTPERRLFQAILLCFLADVQRDYDNFKNAMNGSAKQYRDRLEAHERLSKDRHIEHLCELADINVHGFRKKIRDIIKGVTKIDTRRLYY